MCAKPQESVVLPHAELQILIQDGEVPGTLDQLPLSRKSRRLRLLAEAVLGHNHVQVFGSLLGEPGSNLSELSGLLDSPLELANLSSKWFSSDNMTFFQSSIP